MTGPLHDRVPSIAVMIGLVPAPPPQRPSDSVSRRQGGAIMISQFDPLMRFLRA